MQIKHYLYTLMNTYITSIAILILSLIHSTSYAQCNLENFTVDISDCQDGNTVVATLDFETDNPSNIGYQVFTPLGFTIVQLDEFPYELQLDGNCVTDYILGIRDLSVTDCEVSQNIGVICCDIKCSIEIEVTELQCTEDQSILATVDYNISGTLTDSLDVFTNNTYQYTRAILDANILELPSLGPVQNLVVCEQGTMCCDTIDINDPCFCNIFDIHLAVTDCQPELNNYFLRVDFETTSPSSDSFNIGRPGNTLGSHAYADLPVKVGPISFEEDDNDIFILDQVDAFCFGFIPHITLDSCDAVSCTFTDLTAQHQINCENSQESFITFSFNTTVESSGFTANIDGQVFGPFPYGESEYTVGPLVLSGAEIQLEVIDNENQNCSLSEFVTLNSCNCSIDNLSVLQFCNGEDLIAAQINFTIEGSATDSFDLTIINQSGRYAYSDLPVTINNLTSQDVSLSIQDTNNPSCSINTVFPLECVLECEITNFEVEVLSCDELGVANFAFRFDEKDFGLPEFGLSLNGTLLGFYELQDTGDYILAIQEIDCELDFNLFTVTAIDDAECFAEFALPNTDCCTPCSIDSTEIIVTCLDNFTIDLSLNFDYDGELSDSFDLIFDEQLFGSYVYNDIPLDANLNAAIQDEISYSIVFDNCIFSDSFVYDCNDECIVENIQLDTLTCTNGMFTANLNFDHSESNDSFLLTVNGITDAAYDLNDLPVEIGPYIGDGETEYTFTISVIEFESCVGTFDLGAIDCGPNAIDDYIINNIKWYNLKDGIMLDGVSSFVRMTLIDINGRLIEQQTINSDQFLIHNTDRMMGLYFIRLQDEKGYIHTIKVIL